jgi:hypothetical protein
MSAVMRAMAMTVVRKEATVTSAATRAMEMTVARREVDMVEERDAKNMESAVMKAVVAMVVASDVKSKASVAMRVEAMATTTVPAGDTRVEVVRVDMEVTRDARSPLGTAIDPAVVQDMVAVATKTRDAHRKSAMTADPAEAPAQATEVMSAATRAVEDTMTVQAADKATVGTTPPTTVPPEVKAVATPATEATQAILAPTAASNPPAHPMAVATAAQTTSRAPLSTPNPAAVTPVTPTSSAWLSAF